MLYMLTRMGEAKDWGTGLPLKSFLLGKMNKLEVHHIFPRAQLYKLKYKRPQVNALANFCFLTKDTNLNISDKLPEKYFPEIEAKHPGALASQWIPSDPALWKIENFEGFLEARRALLAAETNKRMMELLHDDTHWMEGQAKVVPVISSSPAVNDIAPELEEEALSALDEWMEDKGLPRGVRGLDLVNGADGAQQVLMDIAWPNGIQEGLSEPVALLLNEVDGVLVTAGQAGFRCFTSAQEFKDYVEQEILAADHV